VNRAGQAPVLEVDGQPLADSTAILRWIDAAAPGRLLPEGQGARARAEAWLWEDFADRSLNGFLVAARWADPRNWPRVRDRYFAGAPWLVRALVAPRVRAGVLSSLRARDVTRHGLEATWRDFDRVLGALEDRAPERGFWLGSDAPTVADLAIFAQLHALRTPLTASQAEAVARRPRLTCWLDRVHEATFVTAEIARRAIDEGAGSRSSPARGVHLPVPAALGHV
jgi:glutathione S-transferase